MWLFIGCGAGRGLSYFLLFSNTSAKIVRFAGLASLFWDFIVDVWQCDLKSTFRILHERVMDHRNRQVQSNMFS
jgi:hypothetical protein